MRHALPALLLLALGGCKLDNPPTTREIHWADAETEELARRACYDCHSNETRWPWYSYAPIVGSLVASDVHRGRCHMNFSEWDKPQEEAEDAPEEVLDGDMPLPLYLSAHKDARLTNKERNRLAAGFASTLSADPPPPGEGPCEDDDGRREREED